MVDRAEAQTIGDDGVTAPLEIRDDVRCIKESRLFQTTH
jgi:hypothetical protein